MKKDLSNFLVKDMLKAHSLGEVYVTLFCFCSMVTTAQGSRTKWPQCIAMFFALCPAWENVYTHLRYNVRKQCETTQVA